MVTSYYAPGSGEVLRMGGWGDFENWHELKTPLVIAIVWLESRSFEATGGLRLLRAVAPGSAVVAAVIKDGDGKNLANYNTHDPRPDRLLGGCRN